MPSTLLHGDSKSKCIRSYSSPLLLSGGKRSGRRRKRSARSSRRSKDRQTPPHTGAVHSDDAYLETYGATLGSLDVSRSEHGYTVDMMQIKAETTVPTADNDGGNSGDRLQRLEAAETLAEHEDSVVYEGQGNDEGKVSEELVKQAVERLSKYGAGVVQSVDDLSGIEHVLDKLHGERVLFRHCRDQFGFDRPMWRQSWHSFREYLLAALDTKTTDVRRALERAIENHAVYDLLWALFLARTVDMYEDAILARRRAADLADLTNPHELYSEARSIGRRIIFHSGPTNSGKTHQAFQRLVEAPSGVYAAPLRLLAAEGFYKMEQHGLLCNLMTGDHRIVRSENATHVACTVEMAELSAPVDVAVIDEVQMTGDADRGWAWTRALLGVRAKEVHVCGEERAVSLVRAICTEMGEEFELRRYERLTPLTVTHDPIGDDLRKLRAGDCVVTFSRSNIFKLKAAIERETGLRCAVVFGGLPPESRLEQARLFNEPDSPYDVLVATDAIGYGLNLNIGRIVFHTLVKFDGVEKRYLEPAQIRQIAGRAGRFGTRFPAGEVTCFSAEDCARVEAAFHPDAVPELEQAGLRPSAEQLEFFSHHFPSSHRLSDLIAEFDRLAKCSDLYFVCDSDDQRLLADLVQDLDLPFLDRVAFTHVPVDTDEPYALRMLRSWAKRYSEGKPVNIYVDVPRAVPKTSAQLKELELAYKVLEAYCWLSFRYPEFFVERSLAEKRKQRCQQLIDSALKDPVLMKEFEERQRARRRAARRGRADVSSSDPRKQRLELEQAKLQKRLEEMGIFAM